MLEHGGKLRAAAARYGIQLERWLDVSTGINPQGYVPPPIPQQAWLRLPQEQDGLEQAATGFYGMSNLLPVAGSQAAIQALPRLRVQSHVAVLAPGYAEHAHAWHRAGHRVVNVCAGEIEAHLDDISVLVLMQPNNPTGAVFSDEQLNDWQHRLAARDGWLVVDEAFIEAGAHGSIAAQQMPRGMIVLRSLGKFFGLAGARVGFVLAHPDMLQQLRAELGPWQVAGPSRFVAQAALHDHEWQAATRARLLQDGARLAQLLGDAGLPPDGGCGLFQWVRTERAEGIHHQLAQRGILARLFTQPRSLRFGLPGSDAEWDRLRKAMGEIL